MAGHRLFRRSLRMLASAMASPRGPEALAAKEYPGSDHSEWMEAPGVQGIGISRRETKGVVREELALTLYVARKLPLEKCRAPAPRELTLPGRGERLRTDVKEIGYVRPLSYEAEYRPSFPGVSVSLADTAPGTLGCWVRRHDEPGTCMLSCSHVLANLGDGPADEPVYQPGEDEAPRPIARLSGWVDFVDRPGRFPNRVDAAIARVADEALVDLAVPGIGVPRGSSLYLRKGMKVRKVGKRTGLTEGRVRDVDFCKVMRYRRPDGTFLRVGFSSLALASMKARPGDSGSAVFNSAGKVIGIVLGGSSSVSVFCRIGPVLSDLGVLVLTE